jgi:hypothetical protein
MAGIRMSPSKLRMGEMKLSKACIQTKETSDFKKMRKVVLTRKPYQVNFHPDMVGAQLLIGQPAGGVLKHFFQEFHQMLLSNLLAGLLSQVLESAVLLVKVHLGP